MDGVRRDVLGSVNWWRPAAKLAPMWSVPEAGLHDRAKDYGVVGTFPTPTSSYTAGNLELLWGSPILERTPPLL